MEPRYVHRYHFINSHYELWSSIHRDFVIEPSVESDFPITALTFHKLQTTLNAILVSGPHVAVQAQMTPFPAELPSQHDQRQRDHSYMQERQTRLEAVFYAAESPRPAITLVSTSLEHVTFPGYRQRHDIATKPLREQLRLEVTMPGGIGWHTQSRFRDRLLAALPYLQAREPDPGELPASPLPLYSLPWIETSIIAALPANASSGQAPGRDIVVRRKGCP